MSLPVRKYVKMFYVLKQSCFVQTKLMSVLANMRQMLFMQTGGVGQFNEMRMFGKLQNIVRSLHISINQRQLQDDRNYKTEPMCADEIDQNFIAGHNIPCSDSDVVSNGAGCAAVGSGMLAAGGSAVDAAIATLLCEGVLLPHSAGIGGGFVATIYTKATRKIETLIAREAAPAAAHKDMFVGQNGVKGALACAVPTEILGYWELHQKYGRLPWKQLFEPTIKLCKEGHLISKYLSRVLVIKEKIIRREPSLSSIFLKKDGTLYKEGDKMTRPALGTTLERIAENGACEMYDGGQIGKWFIEDLQKMGGILTEQDLKNCKVRWQDSQHVQAEIAGGYTLYTTPLPSSGAVLAFILNIMSGLYTEDCNVYWQRIIETYKHAYGQRTNLGDYEGDPEMCELIQETFNKLISTEFADQTRCLIHDDKTFQDYKYYGGNYTQVEDHGTTNMAVLAGGDAITITSTVNTHFGAKIRSQRTGIILNDEMDDFSTPGIINQFGMPASPTNYIRPGKIPMSSMCPSIILDKEGNVRMLVGAAGGTKITTSVATAIIKYLILKKPLEKAVNEGRLHHQLAPMVLDVEPEVPKATQDFLAKIGHKLNILPEGIGFSALTAIGMRDGRPEAYYDRRRVGSTAKTKCDAKLGLP